MTVAGFLRALYHYLASETVMYPSMYNAFHSIFTTHAPIYHSALNPPCFNSFHLSCGLISAIPECFPGDSVKVIRMEASSISWVINIYLYSLRATYLCTKKEQLSAQLVHFFKFHFSDKTTLVSLVTQKVPFYFTCTLQRITHSGSAWINTLGEKV